MGILFFRRNLKCFNPSELLKSHALTSQNPLGKSKILSRYQAFQEAYPSYFIFMQVGEFYEIYGQAAIKASSILDTTLTIAPRMGGERMTGVPIRSIDTYIEKIIKAGESVVICDQYIKDDKLIDRRIGRIVTPGTVIEDGILNVKRNNFIMAIKMKEQEENERIKDGENQNGKGENHANRNEMENHANNSNNSNNANNANNANNSLVGISWMDMSTGYFKVKSIEKSRLKDEILRINPREILIDTDKQIGFKKEITDSIWRIHDPHNSLSSFDSCFKMIQNENNLNMSLLENESVFMIISFLKSLNPNVNMEFNPSRDNQDQFMYLDATTINSLQLIQGNGSLRDAIDRTVTPAGARLLSSRLCQPFISREEIVKRHDSIDYLLRNFDLLREIRSNLRSFKDVERAFQRIKLGRRIHRDVLALKDSLAILDEISEKIFEKQDEKGNSMNRSSSMSSSFSPSFLSLNPFINSLRIPMFTDLCKVLNASICQDEDLLIKDGFNIQLDQLRNRDYKERVKSIEMEYRKRLNKPSLKIEEKKLLGLFVETSKIDPIIGNDFFILDGQTEGKFRYRTRELDNLRTEWSIHKESINQLQREIYNEIIELILKREKDILLSVKNISELDLIMGLAMIAQEQNYHRPHVGEIKKKKAGEVNENANNANNWKKGEINANNSNENEKEKENFILIKSGRHPVLEQNRTFTPNDLEIRGKKETRKEHKKEGNEMNENNSPFLLLTGPNMGGKSTFLRQNALLIILNQIGSFIPAYKANLSIIDSIWTRLGASDDIWSDKSTFMMEMLETATILKNSTKSSLVLLDEVGRGTSSREGLSIAYGISKYLIERGAMVLFATHFSELSKILGEENVQYWRSWAQIIKDGKEGEGNGILFSHRIERGIADHSFAIEIAKMAGIEPKAIEYMKEIVSINSINSINETDRQVI